MNRPKVSVSLITYNQEKYIAECLDSVVSQVTDFDFDIVVADDCSTDKTPEIIASYAARYPNIIKPVLREKNLGLVYNAVATMKSCTGQYIALMEGDDFWVDNNKLQMQADFLDKNDDCVFCFTNQYYFFENKPEEKLIFYNESNKPPEKFDLDYFMETKMLIPNNTKMFRNGMYPETFPDWFYTSDYWDWLLHIFQSFMGKMGYIDKITLGYRRHSEAVFISVKKEVSVLTNSIDTISAINKYLDYRYDYRFKDLTWEYHELAFAYLNKKDYKGFLTSYLKYISILPRLRDIKLRDDFWLFRKGLRTPRQ